MKMKKFITLCIVFCLFTSLTGCSNTPDEIIELQKQIDYLEERLVLLEEKAAEPEEPSELQEQIDFLENQLVLLEEESAKPEEPEEPEEPEALEEPEEPEACINDMLDMLENTDPNTQNYQSILYSGLTYLADCESATEEQLMRISKLCATNLTLFPEDVALELIHNPATTNLVIQNLLKSPDPKIQDMARCWFMNK